MRATAAVVLLAATCAQADTFVERWPVVASEPAAVAERPAVDRPSKATRRARAQQRGFVCHRQYYTIHRHRYWRCRR